METYAKVIAAVADTLTVVLGIIALWALVFHRKKIRAFVQLLAHSLVNERIRRMRGTLTRLAELNYGIKEDRKEIIAIMGELAGMIRTFSKHHEDFLRVYNELILLTTTNPESLSEASKRRIAEELNCLLDEQALAAALNLMEVSNGPKA